MRRRRGRPRTARSLIVQCSGATTVHIYVIKQTHVCIAGFRICARFAKTRAQAQSNHFSHAVIHARNTYTQPRALLDYSTVQRQNPNGGKVASCMAGSEQNAAWLLNKQRLLAKFSNDLARLFSARWFLSVGSLRARATSVGNCAYPWRRRRLRCAQQLRCAQARPPPHFRSLSQRCHTRSLI